MRQIRDSFIGVAVRRAARIDAAMIRWAGAAFVGMALLVLAGSAAAYTQYSVDKDATNCRACHGDFRFSPYTSLADEQSWKDDLHDVHRNVMLDGDCSTCHSQGPRFPVLLGSSVGGDGLDPISCSGCHGRLEDGTGNGTEGYGAGLRQHHWVSGITTCGNAGCHLDADPAGYMPVDEDVLPPYYALNDPNHPLIPADPCNPVADGFPEDYAGTTIGLDNDGDNVYDEAELVACPEPGSKMMLASGLGLLLLIGHHRRR